MKRKEGTFLKDNMFDLESVGNPKKSRGIIMGTVNVIKDRISKGQEIMLEEKDYNDIIKIKDKVYKGLEIMPKEMNVYKYIINIIKDKIYEGLEITQEEKDVHDHINNIINHKIYEGLEMIPEEKEIVAVKELRRVILRYIKWQCIIYVKMQERKKLPDDVTNLMERHLDSTFENKFDIMVKNTLKSFYIDDKKHFIKDVVKKVEDEDEKVEVREYLENMLKK